jgi:hypothetical protein
MAISNAPTTTSPAAHRQGHSGAASRSLGQSLDHLAAAIEQLAGALSGWAPQYLEHAPEPEEPVSDGLSPWERPLSDLSVQELRCLLRSYPLERSSLPAPIELMRRAELVEALHQVQGLMG